MWTSKTSSSTMQLKHMLGGEIALAVDRHEGKQQHMFRLLRIAHLKSIKHGAKQLTWLEAKSPLLLTAM